MKKLLLGLGSIAAVAAPIAAVVSCGDKDEAGFVAFTAEIGAQKGTISNTDASVTQTAETIEGLSSAKIALLIKELKTLTPEATKAATTRVYLTAASATATPTLNALKGHTFQQNAIGETAASAEFGKGSTFYIDDNKNGKRAFGRITGTTITYLFTLTIA